MKRSYGLLAAAGIAIGVLATAGIAYAAPTIPAGTTPPSSHVPGRPREHGVHLVPHRDAARPGPGPRARTGPCPRARTGPDAGSRARTRPGPGSRTRPGPGTRAVTRADRQPGSCPRAGSRH